MRAGRSPWHLKSKRFKAGGKAAPADGSLPLYLYLTLLPQAPGRLPEVWLVGPCHGSSTPARISRSRPPCVFPVSGAGTGRKYPPAVVMARQPTTGCFWDGWDRWAPYLAVIYADSVCTGGLGASSAVAGSAGNVFRIGYSLFKEQRGTCPSRPYRRISERKVVGASGRLLRSIRRITDDP